MCEQCGLVMLWGVAAFLRFKDDAHKPFQVLAGASLVVMLFKPHLFVLFGLGAAVWMVRNRRYTMMSGLGAATVLSQIPLLWYPRVWSSYKQMITSLGIEGEYIPTLGGTLRALTGINFLQVLPLIVGMVWGVWYISRHRNDWNWQEHGLTVLLVSVIVPPYAWITDESILLPAILLGIGRSEKAFQWFIVFNSLVLLGVLVDVKVTSGAYFWTPLAWTAWFYFSKAKAVDHTNDKRLMLLPAGQQPTQKMLVD